MEVKTLYNVTISNAADRKVIWSGNFDSLPTRGFIVGAVATWRERKLDTKGPPGPGADHVSLVITNVLQRCLDLPELGVEKSVYCADVLIGRIKISVLSDVYC